MTILAVAHVDEPAGPADPDRWWEAATCRTMDLDLFFPVESIRNDFDCAIPLAARLACDMCPVSSECLEWALRHEDHGVWANTTPADRRRLRRTLNISVHRPETTSLTPPPRPKAL